MEEGFQVLNLVRPFSEKVAALGQAFYRQKQNLRPDVTNLIATVLIFLVVIYFRSQSSRVKQASYQPMKLFNMPIILIFALVSNLYFIISLIARLIY